MVDETQAIAGTLARLSFNRTLPPRIEVVVLVCGKVAYTDGLPPRLATELGARGTGDSGDALTDANQAHLTETIADSAESNEWLSGAAGATCDAISTDGPVAMRLSPTTGRTLYATVGNCTDLRSTPLSITVRQSRTSNTSSIGSGGRYLWESM